MTHNVKKCSLLIIAAVLVMALAFAGAASADPTVVTTEQELKNALAAGGEVVLGADIATSKELKISNTVTLDLAGHVLKASGEHRMIHIGYSGNLTLKDSSSEGKGMITGGSSTKFGGGVDVCEGTFTMNGGIISDCSAHLGGGVCVDDSGTFTMNSGTITGCNGHGGGGGVYVRISTFIMNGGTISHCIGTQHGGGVHMYRGKFTMNGGTIKDCEAQYIRGLHGTFGGGVHVNDRSTFTMNGGSIERCKVGTNIFQNEGGGVYLAGSGDTFTMTEGIIKDCYAEDYGGGVFVDDGATFKISGGIISGCWVDDDRGGGVYVDDGPTDGKIHISGNAIVLGNKKGNSPNNVYLEADNLLFLDGDFTGCIGISNQDGKFGANNGHKGGEFFFRDGKDYKGMNDGSNLKFNGYVPEFTDITPETNGLVKATNPLTDTSKTYTVGAGNTVRMMTPIVIGTGTARDPVLIQIDGTLLGVKQWPVITVDKGKYLELTGNGVLSDGRSIGSNGGGVNLREGSSLTLDGVTISNNVADKNGGGIYGHTNSRITIKGGNIENNKAGENGGGIYSKGVSVSMEGGEIKDNTAEAQGSGMYVSANTAFNVGNDATIAENWKGDKRDNVYLESNNAVNLFGSLNGQVGISYAGGVPAAGKQFGVVPSASSSGAENIFADGSDLTGSISDNTLVWSQPKTAVMVTFDAQGGTVSPSSKKVFEGESYGILPTPTYASYAFAGWYTGSGGTGNEITKDTKVPAGLGPSQTLYAKWRGPIVTVTFDAQGGTVSPSSKLVVSGEKYGELPTPAREDGWSFAGWYTGSGGTGNEITKDTYVPAGLGLSQTLYAKWEQKSLTVSFKPNGVEVKSTPSAITVITGQPYGSLPIPVPTDDDYTFVGWYLDSACTGAKVTKDTIVKKTEDHDLYAKWFGPFIVSNTNIDFGTVFKDDPIPSLKDMVYTELDGTVTLTFPSGDFGFSNTDTGEELSGKSVTIPKNTQYRFTITPSSTAAEGFYSADIPIMKGAAPLGELSVTMSVVAKNLKNDGKASVPILPIVYNLIDAKNSSSVAWLVGVEGPENLKVDESKTATISLSSSNADTPELQITNVTRKEIYGPTAITLSADSQITAQYLLSKKLMNKEQKEIGTYSVKLGLTDVSRNLPTFTGTFNESLTQVITVMGYTPVAMVSPVNGKTALDMMNLLIKDKGVEVTFTVPVKQLPQSIILTGAVSVFSVDADGNVLALTPDSAKKVGDDYVVTAHASSLSSYVLAFDNECEYYGITPFGGWHGDIDPDYLYHKAGDTVSVTPIPEADYEYWGMLVYNESWSLYTATTGTTFSMPAEHVYLYGLFAEEAPTTCTVSFYMNGLGDPIDPQTVNIGDKAKKPADPTASGYAFVGWFSDIALLIPYDFDTPVTDDITLYAKWIDDSEVSTGHSPSIPSDYTPSSYVEPMEQQTAIPTAQPTPTPAAPTMMPTIKPTATTSKSPAPVAGLIAGLIAGLGGAAFVLAHKRK